MSVQLKSLTPLRGVAAFLVVVYHYSWGYLPNLHTDRVTHLIHKGYLTVDLFFLLSGFVITHVYKDGFGRQATPGGYADFLKARVARLFPLHVCVTGLFVATAVLAWMLSHPAGVGAAGVGAVGVGAAGGGAGTPMPLTGPHSLLALGANLLMLQGLKAGALSWNYPSWSISQEFIAYLLFPFLFPAIRRAGARARQALAALLCGVLLVVGTRSGVGLDLWDGPATLFRCLPQFLLGSLLYLLFESGWAAPLLRRDAVLAAALGGAALLMHLGAPDLTIVPCFALAILAGTSNAGRLSGWLDSAPLVWLGEVSYSLYLVHGLVQYATSRAVAVTTGTESLGWMSPAQKLSLLAAMILASLALSALTYRHIEIPGRRLLRTRLGLRGAEATGRPAIKANGW